MANRAAAIATKGSVVLMEDIITLNDLARIPKSCTNKTKHLRFFGPVHLFYNNPSELA